MKRIALTQGQVALVDDDLFDQLNAFKWFAYRAKGKKAFYARRATVHSGKQTMHHMHRVVWEMVNGPIPRGYSPDHIDGNGLNNQIGNLRLATMSQQCCNRQRRADNTSGFIGVTWHKPNRNWVAATMVDGVNRHIGVFDDPFSAAWVRDKYVRRTHGEFATLNNLVDRRSRSRY